MNADVEKAVERAVRHTDFGRPLLAADLQTIRQALRDQEAEIVGLRADLSDADERAAMRNRERTEAVMRAEKAEALLREAYCHGYDFDIHERIRTFLGLSEND